MTESPSVASASLTAWTASHVDAIRQDAANSAPLIQETDFSRIGPELDIWDAWPIQDADGTPSRVGEDQSLWMALGAPRFADPDERHSHARIHLLSRSGQVWRHLGPAMPDDFSPGSREWSGSAVLDADGTSLTLYFTATGRRGEPEPTFEQRLLQAKAMLTGTDGNWRLENWHGLNEIVVRDPCFYMASDAGTGKVGSIKAFRDPAYFRDPADGSHHLFFAASLAGSVSAFNGVIGSARARSESAANWQITPPLLSADSLNNELERPHVVHRDGFYYLFWSTQRHVFNPEGPTGPTGLYGMVAECLSGPWRPLNGTGLVFANPPSAPTQAYSWLVLPDLQVASFVDDWGSPPDQDGAKRFGATFAPMLRLFLRGDAAGLDAEA